MGVGDGHPLLGALFLRPHVVGVSVSFFFLEQEVGSEAGVSAGAEDPGGLKATPGSTEPKDDSVRSFVLGIVWILTPLLQGIAATCGHIHRRLGAFQCYSRFVSPVILRLIGFMQAVNIGPRGMAAIFCVLVIVGVWWIFMLFGFFGSEKAAIEEA